MPEEEAQGLELGAEARALLRLWSRASRPQDEGGFIDDALALVRDRLGFDEALVIAAEQDSIVASTPGAGPLDPGILALARDAQARRGSVVGRLSSDGAFAIPAQDGRHVLVLRAAPGRGATSGDAPALARVIADALGARLTPDDGNAFLAYHDPLTLLPNRTAFAERLEDVLAGSERTGTLTALLYVDLDGFKAVNDGHGHATGDIVLAEVAHRLRDTLRRSEFVARLGGDEFAVIVHPAGGVEAADDIARRILDAIAEPFVVDGVTFSISASIGIAFAPGDARTIDGLLRFGDEAMYRAKESGGGRAQLFGDDIQARIDRRRRLLHDLTGDVLANEFLLCYQPIVATRSGALVGAEALPRWRHPHYGLLSASTIFASLGASRVVEQIDAWVLAEAQEESARLRAQGLDVAVHVNLASLDTTALVRLDNARGKMILEFSEPAAVRDIDATVAFCKAAHGMGFEVGIDHFGSTPVRLREIARLPLDFVKVDATLLEMPAFTAAVALANSLGWRTLASGVGSARQLRQLADVGVDCVQGYHLGPPMTAADFVGWAETVVT